MGGRIWAWALFLGNQARIFPDQDEEAAVVVDGWL
jgi:hypothetical protein